MFNIGYSELRGEQRGVVENTARWLYDLASQLGQLRAGERQLTSVTRALPARTHLTHARSPQFGIISTVTSSYLREWVFNTGLFSSGVICVARQ